MKLHCLDHCPFFYGQIYLGSRFHPWSQFQPWSRFHSWSRFQGWISSGSSSFVQIVIPIPDPEISGIIKALIRLRCCDGDVNLLDALKNRVSRQRSIWGAQQCKPHQISEPFAWVKVLQDGLAVPWSAPGCRAGNGGKISNSWFDGPNLLCLAAV